MSQVISLRLDRENPREGRALLVLATWQAEGYGVRQIITEALLKLGTPDSTQTNIALDELNCALRTIGQLLDSFNKLEPQTLIDREDITVHLNLTDHFIGSITKAVKPGIREDKMNA